MSCEGTRDLIFGNANQDLIAYGCAKAFRREGAEPAVTHLNTKAEPYVRPLAEERDAAIVEPFDARIPGQLEVVFLASNGARAITGQIFISTGATTLLERGFRSYMALSPV